MPLPNKAFLSFIILLCMIAASLAENFKPFSGVVNEDNINIRSDSTVNAKIICTINKDQPLEVVAEKYGWYKVRLPKNAASFVRKDLVTPIDNQTLKISKDKVNIRLQPNEESPILGQADKNEVVIISESKGQWYKIEPINNSFGWIYKKFLDMATQKIPPPPPMIKPAEETITIQTTEEEKVNQDFIIEGVIKPYGKVFNRRATHKLIDNKTADVYLLKGDRQSLDALNYHRVKITGKLLADQKSKYPIVEVIKMEMVD